MAAIDKLYVHSYYEYDDLRRWAIAYYPELLFYFYDITTTYQEWENNCRHYVATQLKIAERDYNKIASPDETVAVQNLIKQYKEVEYNCSLERAQEEVDAIFTAYRRTVGEWEDLYSYPVMNTPLEVDRKLLWICPVPCVRKYLHEQCGYKTHWYNKLFWRGKKHF